MTTKTIKFLIQIDSTQTNFIVDFWYGFTIISKLAELKYIGIMLIQLCISTIKKNNMIKHDLPCKVYLFNRDFVQKCIKLTIIITRVLF